MDGVGSAGSRNPAADDNGSGVVDLLELARALSSHSFERTVVLFFSTGEEQGTLGVRSYLSQLTASQLSSIKSVINIDMVGYDANHDWAMELWHGGHAPSLALAQWMKETIKGQQFNLVPELVVGCG
jgi:putative aminopeptidase FrvX